MVEAFPLIELHGTPEARGRLYGQQAAERIRRSIGHYAAQLSAAGHGAERVRGWARDFVPSIEAFEPSFVAEMRGISEGANVPFEDIVLINARTEVLQLGKRSAAAAVPSPKADPDGCTGVILLPEATQDGLLVHGQNWDWKSECAETGVVLRIREENGPDILTFVEAGGLARAGLNSAGVAVTANYLESDRDYRELGVPLALLRRKFLQSEHLAMAMRTAYVTKKSGSNNIMLSHADGVALNFECAPDETFLVHPQNGMLVHANHWQSPVALGKLKDTGIANTPDTLYRDMRVRSLLEAKQGRLDMAAVRDALFDDFQHPWAVCRPPRLSLAGNLSATVAMLLMQPKLGVLEIAPLPAINKTFTRYTLDGGAAQAVAA
ncbi:acyl-CoA--6-aminopenicillanic acid acyltransferase [Roseomonas aerophila]|uniref:Acyl-CoA--6-aminopenicillanic acid acyltransferase n=1 Tax=Teichococcus aerophilus TaxID=1224513 RepID=A0ABR7RGK0_9PROT|nr:C45 family peptidase [Pseudoroseomonas aerophila]MBC9205503.1 acyl-CoA--6-aminopenicillanic acid acyltransferase [Pseudoroseomonas aerophila]